MARVSVTDRSGVEIHVPDRVSSDDFDAPEVRIIVCDAFQFIDPTSQELRFIPPPPPPVIERVEIASADNMGTVGMGGSARPTEIELPPANGDAAAIESLEERLARLRERMFPEQKDKVVRSSIDATLQQRLPAAPAGPTPQSGLRIISEGKLPSEMRGCRSS